MKRSEKLRAFYNEELVNDLVRVDSLRKRILVQLGIVFGIAGLAFPLMAYFLITVAEPRMVFFFIPIFALLAIFVYIIWESVVKNTPFYKEYKKNVIYKLIKFINPTLRYDRRHFISQQDYFKSGFFEHVPVKVVGDDHVAGRIDDVEIEFSELEVSFRRPEEKKSKHAEYQFKGIFFIAKTPRPYPADIIIEPKGFKTGDNVILVPTDSEKFNEHFQVRVPNKDYIRQVKEMLSDDLLEKVLSFGALVHHEIHLSFIYNKLYVAIRHDKDLFEPSLWHSVMNYDMVHIHFNDLFYPISIIEHFAAYKELEIEDELKNQTATEGNN